MLGEGHADIVERHLISHKKDRILHVGPSSNPVTNKNVASLVDEVICGDLKIPTINLVKRKIPRIVPVAMDLFQMPFREDTFDLVLAIGIPQLYERPVEGLIEFKRVNAKGGKLIVCNRDGGNNVCFDQYKRMVDEVGYRILEESIGIDSEERTNRYLLVLQK